MKAKINESGMVVWVGNGEGDDWVDMPTELPEKTDEKETLHYDRENENWSYR